MRANEVGGVRGRADAASEASRFGESLRTARRRAVEPHAAERAGPPSSGARGPDGPLAQSPRPPPPVFPAEPDGAAPEIAALLRALPVSMTASREPREVSLSLTFGRSLHVELRARPEGIDLVLRPDDRLRGAATAELPRIVAALGARGIAVGRAEIRGRTASPPRRRAR